jgi:predicted secreted protein
MSASQGKIGFGTLLKIGDGASPEVFTTIPECFSIAPVGATAPLVDFTHHESPNRTKEWKHGVKDGDEISVQGNYLATNANQQLVRTAFDDETTDNWQLVLTTAAGATEETFSFAAIVTHWDVDPQLEDRRVFNFTLKRTGAVSVA